MKKLTIALVLTAITVSACGGATDGGLVVYSGRTENLVGPLFEDFTEQTGIAVEVRYGQSADLALLIQQEGDRSPADVFISQSPGAIGLLAGENLLAKLSDETGALVPVEYRNTSREWIGLSGRVRVVVYNSDLVDGSELPASVFDLVEPRYRGRVALAPANGSFQDFVTGMREVHGDELTLSWLTAMDDNESPTYANNTAIVQAVARGEVEMGLVNHYYNLRALAEDPSLPSVNHFFEDVGSLVIITAIGILDSSSDVEKAEELVRFLLSPRSQQFFSEETFEYPLATGSQATAELTDLVDLQVMTYDFEDLSGGLTRTKELIDASGLEAP
ncbi:MAG: extracellular solute-binding protein [Actinomycetota bacterium]|nr:extracellular solute-binding protein [Actinomycetota bacterium]